MKSALLSSVFVLTQVLAPMGVASAQSDAESSNQGDGRVVSGKPASNRQGFVLTGDQLGTLALGGLLVGGLVVAGDDDGGNIDIGNGGGGTGTGTTGTGTGTGTTP